MDYSGKNFAEAIGVTNVSVSRWENDGQGIPKTTDILLRVMTLSDLGYQGNISELMLEISRSEQVDVRIDLDALMQDTSNVVMFIDPSASIVEADLDISAHTKTILKDDALLDSANG
jgi:transcriptional regulator with XRE-family HTH domain